MRREGGVPGPGLVDNFVDMWITFFSAVSSLLRPLSTNTRESTLFLCPKLVLIFQKQASKGVGVGLPAPPASLPDILSLCVVLLFFRSGVSCEVAKRKTYMKLKKFHMVSTAV